jgi:hypothetical protein
MAEETSDRARFFPAIEKKHGLPMAYWFDQMKEISDWKYPSRLLFYERTMVSARHTRMHWCCTAEARRMRASTARSMGTLLSTIQPRCSFKLDRAVELKDGYRLI